MLGENGQCHISEMWLVPLKACPDGIQSPGSLVPWLGEQLGFLATYSYHSLFKIKTKAGDRTPTRRPQGQLPLGASTIYFPVGANQ